MNAEVLQELLETLPPSKSIGISHASAPFSSAVIVARKETEKEQFVVSFPTVHRTSSHLSSKAAAITIESFLKSKSL